MSLTNTTETKDQIVTCNLISQRNRFLSLLTPPPRYTPVSPYPTFTKAQLDMRRKVEILQYKKNTTQLYQATKTQKWSQIANASSNRFTICNKNPYTPSPSSACDVPGPLVYLSYDPTVPLYNYATKQETYASYYTSPDITWNFTLDYDMSGGLLVSAFEGEHEPQEGEEGYEVIEYESTLNTLVGSLMIQNIKEAMTTYQFTIPIGLFADGTTFGTPDGTSMIVQITKATLNVYFYSDSIAGPDPTSAPLVAIPITNVLSNTNILDMSMSFVPTVTNGNFSCYQYIGDIIVPNIKLNTSYGFLYDFRLKIELSCQPVNMPAIDHENYLNFGVYENMPNYNTSASGCIVYPQRPDLWMKYLPFSFVQTSNP